MSRTLLAFSLCTLLLGGCQSKLGDLADGPLTSTPNAGRTSSGDGGESGDEAGGATSNATNGGESGNGAAKGGGSSKPGAEDGGGAAEDLDSGTSNGGDEAGGAGGASSRGGAGGKSNGGSSATSTDPDGGMPMGGAGGAEPVPPDVTCTDKTQNYDETATDCGGQFCDPCGVGLTCHLHRDCLSASCSVNEADETGTCLPAECSDGTLNGFETSADCGGGACDPCGPGLDCNLDTDCDSDVCNDTLPTPQCATPACDDGTANGDETGADCGFTVSEVPASACGLCPEGESCDTDADCETSYCAPEGVCRSPGCGDEAQNGDETDLNCGGPQCSKCLDTEQCVLARDCESDVCAGNPLRCQAPSCTDGVRNGTESDINCGGSCAPCTTGKRCNTAGDCQDLVCRQDAGDSFKVCKPPACDDGVKNGDEPTVDCSTSCPSQCRDGALCTVHEDCMSNNCIVGSGNQLRCAAPTCADGRRNQGETDVDCGGTNCSICDVGKMCLAVTDCVAVSNASNLCDSVCGFACNAGRGDCGGGWQNGCETNTNTDVDHCGTCTTVCPSGSNATRTCTTSGCGLNCSTNFDDCTSANGCETNITTSTSHCGACNNACSSTNGTASCSGGACAIACTAPFKDCTGGVANGCETNTSNNTAHCGVCGNVCGTGNNTARSCVSSACAFTCSSGFKDCNGLGPDGCEINTNTDTSNCGTCSNICSSNHGTASCTGGSCEISCTSPYKDCTGGVADGCETNTTNTTAHCGACNNACGTQHNSARSCSNSACSFTCDAGYKDCNGLGPDGCEINTNTDINNCGVCGNVCPAGNGTAMCTNGVCGITCTDPFKDCTAAAGCETNASADINNCGGCNLTCGTGNNTARSCSNSQCMFSCSGNYEDCNLVGSDGCEINTDTDPNNCGVCGNVCPSANGVASCVAGECQLACTAPFKDCTGTTDGCETNTNTSTSNCGACSNTCGTANNSARSCASGACTFTCSSTFKNCNGLGPDGCECNGACSLGTSGVCCQPVAINTPSASLSQGACFSAQPDSGRTILSIQGRQSSGTATATVRFCNGATSNISVGAFVSQNVSIPSACNGQVVTVVNTTATATSFQWWAS